LPGSKSARAARVLNREPCRSSTTKPESIASLAGAVGLSFRMYSRNLSRRCAACIDFDIVAGIAPQARVYMRGVPLRSPPPPFRRPHLALVQPEVVRHLVPDRVFHQFGEVLGTARHTLVGALEN